MRMTQCIKSGWMCTGSGPHRIVQRRDQSPPLRWVRILLELTRAGESREAFEPARRMRLHKSFSFVSLQPTAILYFGL